ncbi:MAG: ATP-binding cassette domain-containing protein, partial [Gammaproteobacteria bacterium]|nr:ATP-binding cassette domain-containing protein [Gammaproteobacteria bacterium]
QLDLSASPLQLMIRLSPSSSELSLRNYLGSFGFHGADVDKTASLFSGGEKSRLGLALMIWQKPNVLLLDEPTNHLDLEMRHALTMALQDFEGAVVLISHDRHLIKCTTDDLYLAADGQIKPFKGGLEEYSEWLSAHRKQASSESEPVSSDNQNAIKNKKGDRKKAAERRQQLKPLRDRQKKAEKAMERLSDKKEQVEAQLSDNTLYEENNKDELKKLLSQQAGIQKELEQVELDWMDISEELDAMQAEDD